MIKFFRKIRQSLLAEGKFKQYLKYAIGEIVLVVVGILIALQVNNWNSDRKQQKETTENLKALKVDLQKDIEGLTEYIKYLHKDIDRSEGLKRRLENPLANLDTLIHIARYEFYPFYDITPGFNTNTFNSLTASGAIQLLDTALQNDLLQLNAQQKISSKGVEINQIAYRNTYGEYRLRYSYNDSLKGRIHGFVDDVMWSNVNEQDLAAKFSATLLNKLSMQRHILWLMEPILTQSIELNNTINDQIL